MKVLFFYPNWFNINWIPLGIAVLSARLEEKGIDVEYFGTTFYVLADKEYVNDLQEGINQGQYIKTNFNDIVNFETITFKELTDRFIKVLDEFEPDLIAVSSITQFYEQAVKVLEKSNVKVPVVVGGVDPTVAPDDVISLDGVDMICIGEGEEPLAELCDRIAKGRDYTDIKNLWVKKNGQVIKNEKRPLMDMSQVPTPDFSLFDDRYFYQQFLGGVYRTAPYQIVRGCPYSCTYCNIPSIRDNVYKGLGKYLRRKSFSESTRELRYLKERYNIEIVRFVDDTFLAMPIDALKELADLYEQNVDLPCFINTRPETVTREKVEILRKMKCVSVSIGLETGNTYMRTMTLNRGMSDEVLLNAFRYLREVNIRTSSQTMIGLPFENRDTIFETIELNRKCDPDAVSAHIFYPYKGIVLREICLKEGFITGFEGNVSTQVKSVLRMPNISSEEIEALKKTFSLYCNLPKVYWPLVRICERDNKLSNFLYLLFSRMVRNKQQPLQTTKAITSLLQASLGH